MNCEKIQIDLSAYLDEELSDSRFQEVESHLETCSDCHELLQLLDSTRAVFRSVKPDEVSQGFKQEVKDTINAQDSGPANQWLRWAVPIALAASLAVLFFWNDDAVIPVRPTGPMSGPEIYEQMVTMNLQESLEMIPGEPPSMNTNQELPGLDPNNTIPGMGDYYYYGPESSS